MTKARRGIYPRSLILRDLAVVGLLVLATLAAALLVFESVRRLRKSG